MGQYIVRPDKASAQALCDKIDKMLGIPPEGLPGVGGPGRTMRWAEPVELDDGTFGVPVPKKGLLKNFIDGYEKNSTAIEDFLTKDKKDKDGNVVEQKRIKKADFDDVVSSLATKTDKAPKQTDGSDGKPPKVKAAKVSARKKKLEESEESATSEPSEKAE